MKLKRVLLFCFSGLAATGLVVSAIGFFSLNRASQQFDQFVHGVTARVDTVERYGMEVQKRAIAARNLLLLQDAGARKREAAAARQSHEEVRRLLAHYNDLVREAIDMSDAARALARRINELEEAYGKIALAVVQKAVDGDRDAALAQLEADCLPRLIELTQVVGEYQQLQAAAVEVRREEMKRLLTQAVTAMAIASLLALCGSVALGFLVTGRVMRQLGADPSDLNEAASRVAAGDLSALRTAGPVAAGSVLGAMDEMRQRLADMTGQLRLTADHIANAAGEVRAGNRDLSGRTEQQAAALEQTAATMEELGQTVRNNADSAQRANALAGTAADIASKGGHVVGEVVQTMRGINDSSRKIAEIIGVIDGIAFQTNILALNAAVEAARAGEQGRGFAVVAGEVRTLAQRSATAAREIKSLIAASVEQVEQGSDQADRAGQTMDEIVQSIRNVSVLVEEISQASVEQSEGVAQVGQAVTLLDQNTQQNAALVEQGTAAAESLAQQADAMRDLISRFRTGTVAQAA